MAIVSMTLRLKKMMPDRIRFAGKSIPAVHVSPEEELVEVKELTPEGVVGMDGRVWPLVPVNGNKNFYAIYIVTTVNQ